MRLGGSGFDAVRGVRLYEIVLRRLAQYIRASEMGPGSRFPPEREIATQLGVSRATLREAFRVLESLGVARSRGGDGRYLETADLGALEDGRLFARARVESWLDVWEARLILEVGAVRLAAQRASRQDLESLASLAAKIHECSLEELRQKDYDLDFHTLLAEATGNKVIAESARRYMHTLKTLRQKLLMDPEAWRSSCEEHIAIARAILDRDQALAAQLMEKHINGVRAAVLDYCAQQERAAGGERLA